MTILIATEIHLPMFMDYAINPYWQHTHSIWIVIDNRYQKQTDEKCELFNIFKISFAIVFDHERSNGRTNEMFLQ